MAVMAFCQANRGEDRAVLAFLAGVCTGKGASHEIKAYSTVHTFPSFEINILRISSRLKGREPSRPMTLT
jgi:hypothetical protein